MFEKVYQIVRQIPQGKVLTYGDIALILREQGCVVSAQLVGFALHANKSSDHASCHRVVNKKGRVAPSFAFGGDTLQKHVDLSQHHMFSL